MLEVIAVTAEEARIAEAAGAGRIELVAAFSEGGLTPDFDLVQRTVAAVRIPVNVMIRPHARGFHYSRGDIEGMKQAILATRSMGANGVVLGVLDGDRDVHTAHLEELLACTGALEVTFHRAIDESREPVAAVAVLSRYPAIRTILTSGGRTRIEDNAAILIRMRAAAGHLRIMAGGGLTLDNADSLIRATALQDYHFGTGVRRGRTVTGVLDPERLETLGQLLRANGIQTIA